MPDSAVLSVDLSSASIVELNNVSVIPFPSSSSLAVSLEPASVVELAAVTLVTAPVKSPEILSVGVDNTIYAGQVEVLIEGKNFGDVTSITLGGEPLTIV